MSEPNKSYVYLIRNVIENKIYIGASKGGKTKPYWGSSKYLNKDIAKYGLENFKKTILNTYDTLQDAYNTEDVLVDENFVSSPHTYNKMPSKHQRSFTSETASFAGKTAWDNMSDERKFETRSKAGKIGGKKLKGKTKSLEHKQNLSKSLKGRVINDEWKNKMKEAQKERWSKTLSDPNYVHTSKGRCWINKNGNTKMITKNELPTYLSDGWSKGRKV